MERERSLKSRSIELCCVSIYDYRMPIYSVFLRGVIDHMAYHKYLRLISYSEGYIRLVQSRPASKSFIPDL